MPVGYNTSMAKKQPTPGRYRQPYRYASPHIPLSVIRRYARQIAERFQPEKIILFGSYAYGTPHADSDVDLLVIMPARNQLDQAGKIRWQLPAPFPMDLLVRTPKNMKWRLEEGDWFLREITSKGKVLYEKTDRRMAAQPGPSFPRPLVGVRPPARAPAGRGEESAAGGRGRADPDRRPLPGGGGDGQAARSRQEAEAVDRLRQRDGQGGGGGPQQ